MRRATYFFFFLRAVYWAMGAIEDPASLPPSTKTKANTWDSLKCGVAEQLQTVSQRVMVKVNCKQFSNLDDTPAMIMSWRSTLPTSRPYQGWEHNDPNFAEKLYKSLEVGDGFGHYFVAVSPLGLWMVLAVLAVGAVDDTKHEILQVLEVSAGKLTTHYKTMIEALDTQNPSPLKVISKFYLDKEFDPIGAGFRKQIQDLGAKFEKVNFKKQYEAEITKINDVVSQETGGIIKDVVSEGTVNENTNLLMLSILYFNGKWEIPFSKEVGKFKTSKENHIEATYLSQGENYYYYKEVKASEYKMLELPYASDVDKPPQFSLIIILPEKLDGLSKLMELITEDHTWLKNFDIESSDRRVLIKPTIPRFTVDAKLELKPTLIKLGINKVFDVSDDLRAISHKNFKLSSIQQRIYIIVDEKDDNAAGSGVYFDIRSLMKSSAAVKDGSFLPHSAKTFLADHPFAFALIQRTTKTVVVMGQVMRPG